MRKSSFKELLPLLAILGVLISIGYLINTELSSDGFVSSSTTPTGPSICGLYGWDNYNCAIERCRGELDTWEVAKLLNHDHWLVRRECLIQQFDRGMVTREMLQGVAISDPHWQNRDLAVQLLGDPVISIGRVGIGVERVEPGWVVEEVYPGGPADVAGLKQGDLIIRIAEEGEPWVEITELQMPKQIVNSLFGPVGSKVWLEVKRAQGSEPLGDLTLEELRIHESHGEVETLTIAVVKAPLG